MTYAFLTEGLDPEAREKFDEALKGKGDDKTKARREREAVAALGPLGIRPIVPKDAH